MTEDSPKAPSGTVTFVFSDIEGSTQRWDADRQAMQAAVRRHDLLMREAIESNGGYIFKTIGDAFCAAFPSSEQALAATLQAQRGIGAEEWSEVGGLRVRFAIHTGIADERDNDYFGPTVNRVARLLSIGHGGQVLVSGAARSLIEERTIPEISLVDLGIHRLKDLSAPEHVFQLSAPGLATDFPALRSVDLAPNNLPASLTPLLGRDREVSEIEELIERSRCVTLVGSGGVGKTRTAQEVAAELAHDDGAWFIDLASITDPAFVPSAIAAALKIAYDGGDGLLEHVVGALQTKKLLLVFDNCEQIVAGVAAVVDATLRGCPNVRVLATSREPLGVAGEATYRLPMLGTPGEGEALTAQRAMEFGAVALFVTRAQFAQKSFALTDDNAPVVGEIVRRLDGIALAIELAAARVKLLNVTQLAQRLGDRLKLLTGGSRTASPRQQTLRSTIAWSYELLDDVEKSVLRQAALLRGTWTLDAIAAVWQDERFDDRDSFDLIAALVDKSLVVVEHDEEESRYRLLESTREFAEECLDASGERNAAAQRHCSWFAARAAEADQAFWRDVGEQWFAATQRDAENFRTAINWALENAEPAAAATMTAALRQFWWNASPSEGRALLQRVEEGTPDWDDGRTRGLFALSSAMFVDSPTEGLAMAREACDLLAAHGGAQLHVEALVQLAQAVANAGDLSKAMELAESIVAQPRTALAARQLGWALSSAAYVFACGANLERSRALLEEAAPIVRRGNDAFALARLQLIRGEVVFSAGDAAEALTYAREAETIFREGSSQRLLCPVLFNRTAYLISLGQIDEALVAVREGLTLVRERGDGFGVAIGIGHTARIAAETQRCEVAARLLGYVDAFYARVGSVREPTEQRGYDRTRSLIAAALPAERVTALTGEGAAMEQSAAVEEALALHLAP